MKELWKELCEIEGIKFYDTSEMGIACRVSEINKAITGEANRNNLKQDMLDYEHVKAAFPNSEERDRQIQYLEYDGTGEKLFISLKLVLVHLERGSSHKYKEGWDRVLQAMKENPTLNSTPCFNSIKEILPQGEEDSILKSIPYSTNQKETVKEFWEIEGIKFYDTPEIGIACRMSEINIAINGRSTGGFKRNMLNYQHIQEAFTDSVERDAQIQNLGEDQRVFVTLKLVHTHLKGTTPGVYKERYDRILQGIEENFPQLNETSVDPDITSDPNTASTSVSTSALEQPMLPTMEKEEYSFLYIAKAGIVDASEGHIIDPLDIHFGITADDPKNRIKAITRGSYKAELVATIAFRGIQKRKDGSRIPCEECVALETWFKNNPEWVKIRGSDESFRYEDPWKELLREIENSPNTGRSPYSLYPDSPVIKELVPEHLILKVHDFGESLEMIEIARLYKGNVIPDENNLNVSFDGDWIVVQGLHRVKKR